nr:aldehyde dehydrogenase family protein [Streptomyces sp. TLI_105]
MPGRERGPTGRTAGRPWARPDRAPAAGQNFIGTQRILIAAWAYESFRDAFVARTKQLRVGDPLDVRNDNPRSTERGTASGVSPGAGPFLLRPTRAQAQPAARNARRCSRRRPSRRSRVSAQLGHGRAAA